MHRVASCYIINPMELTGQTQNRTVRNLVIFAVVVLAIGWLGHGLDILMQNPPSQKLGMLLWLVAPLVTALLLRGFAGDGWKDFGLKPDFKRNWVWYVFSLLICPVIAALILIVGRISGLVTFSLNALGGGGDGLGRSLDTLGLFLSVFAAGLLPAFFKNIFEEFAWRGYLAPRVTSLERNDYLGHLSVGLIWGAWHIPYYLFFLERTIIQSYTTLDLGIFILMTILGIVSYALVYGEIRLLTNSVWPPLLIHMISNAFVDPLVVQGFVKIVPGMDFLVSPGGHSILSIALFIFVGVGLHQWRMRNQLRA